jgi:hypothetical protein
MRSHGTDRVRRGNGEQWIILSRQSKGWVPRTPAAVTRNERPGTTVRCEETYYEVVSATATAGGIRYVLEPWRDENVMRIVDDYDEASEARRQADHHDGVRRERGRISANILAVFSGQLPGPVQERMGNELGIWPARLTLTSILPAMVFVGVVVNLAVHRRMEEEAPLPLWLLLAAGYLLAESGIRFVVAMTQNRPIGSAAGFIAYSLYYLAAPGRKNLVRPLEESRGSLVPEMTEEKAARDRYLVLEPLLTLLSPADQDRLAAKFGFDYRKMASIVAAVILTFGVLGVVNSISLLIDGARLSPAVSLLVAGGLAAEQIVRLMQLRERPAGSVLGVLVRPLARKLLTPGVERASHG